MGISIGRVKLRSFLFVEDRLLVGMRQFDELLQLFEVTIRRM
jgi:hypothetical protein